MGAIELEVNVEEATESPVEHEVRLAWHASVEAIPLGFGRDAEPLVVDWFGNGQPDLLVTAEGGPAGRSARIYRPAPASGQGPRRYDAGSIVAGLDGLRCVARLPNDASTRFDLIAIDPAGAGLVLLRNEGTADRPAFRGRRALGIAADLGIGPCRIIQMVALDWDGDGLPDLLVGVDDLTGYWPHAERVPPAQMVGFNQQGAHPGYDARGGWHGGPPRGRIFWLRNTGKPGDPAFVLQPEISGEKGRLELALHPAPLVIAWEGTGNLEVLITDARAVVHIHRNFGGQRPPVLMEPRTLQCGHSPLLLPDDRTMVIAADIDGDRREEIVYGTSDGRVFAVHAGRTRNEAKTPAVLLQEPAGMWLGGGSVLAVADLDNDGDLDLISGDASGRLHYFQDLGSAAAHRYAAPVPVEAGGVHFRLDPGADGRLDGPVDRPLGHACPALVDWAGHGRIDLIVSGAGGEVFFLRNDGAATDPRFGAPAPFRCQGQPLILPPRVRPAAADWTGSGRIDLIALDLQGFLVVFPQVSTLELGPPVPIVDRLGRLIRLDGGYRQSGRCALWAGAWTGSGRVDLLVGLPRGNRHVIPSLTGLPLTDVDDLPTVLLLERTGDDAVVARPLRQRDGRPLVVGTEGCSPSGVAPLAPGSSGLDLIVGSDDGHPQFFRREELCWPARSATPALKGGA
jgi:hypothetical protein